MGYKVFPCLLVLSALFLSCVHGLPTTGNSTTLSLGLASEHSTALSARSTTGNFTTPPFNFAIGNFTAPVSKVVKLGKSGITNPNPNNIKVKRYTALGDTYAAGVGLGYPRIGHDPDNERCRRTEWAYPFQFASDFGELIGLEFFNFPACAQDKTVVDLYNQIMSGSSLSPLPYMHYDFGQPDLVTISGFAFDQAEVFPSLLRYCVYPLHTEGNTKNYRTMCRDLVQQCWKIVKTSRPNWEKLLKHAVTYDLLPNQNREVYVTGLPTTYSMTEDHCPDDLKTPQKEIKNYINLVSTYFNEELSKAASSAGAHFVNVENKFDKHRVCDKDSWIQTGVGQEHFYPTGRGSGAVSEALAESLLHIYITRNNEDEITGIKE